jgi:hypothetical protein
MMRGPATTPTQGRWYGVHAKSCPHHEDYDPTKADDWADTIADAGDEATALAEFEANVKNGIIECQCCEGDD